MLSLVFENICHVISYKRGNKAIFLSLPRPVFYLFPGAFPSFAMVELCFGVKLARCACLYFELAVTISLVWHRLVITSSGVYRVTQDSPCCPHLSRR